jgi:hypothetical protein
MRQTKAKAKEGCGYLKVTSLFFPSSILQLKTGKQILLSNPLGQKKTSQLQMGDLI